MVFTLQRYVFRELFRVFLLATIGLTLILSLGGVLAPVQEYGVGPRQVLHILLYFMPITLTFVLPMAALFASSLTYGRFASDNELDACRASGVSLYTMVYPGLTLAILVAIANLLLSFHVMPYFVHLAEKSLKADAKQILFRNIQRRGFYKMPPDGRFLLYADNVDPTHDTLSGIVVVQAERGVIKDIRTADAARVQFDPRENVNEVTLDVFGFHQMAQGGSLGIFMEQGSFQVDFGSLLGDDIKFKRVHEMKQIRANLMLFDPIAQVAREAYRQLATEALAQRLSDHLRSPDSGAYELRGSDRSIRFTAQRCALDDEGEINLIGPIRVEEYDAVSGLYLQTLQCDSATLHVDKELAGPGLSLDLYSPKVEGTGQLPVRHVISKLMLPQPLQQDLHRAGVLKTVVPDGAAGVLKGPPTSMLASLQKQLNREIHLTMLNITAEMNSRLVFGIGCVPMIMIGIGLGIINRGGHILSAFGAGCVPAAVLIVAIISGKHLTENMTSEGVSGIAIMWAGLAALTVLAAFLYGRLART
jgi:lipopolysaccharide export system permease protein